MKVHRDQQISTMYKIVPSQDLLEIGAIFISFWILYVFCTTPYNFLLGIAFVAFAGWPLLILPRKNKSRWCGQCGSLMDEGTVPNKIGPASYELVYKCQKCSIVTKSGLFTDDPIPRRTWFGLDKEE